MKFISAIVYKGPVWSLLVPLCTRVQYEVYYCHCVQVSSMKFISAIVYKGPVWSLLVPLCTSVQYEVY